MTLAVLSLLTIALVPLGPPGAPVVRRQYVPYIAWLEAFLAFVYILNAAGRYRLAAGLTVVVAMVAPWISALIDPEIFLGDFVPLTYAMISVMLCSILMSPRMTMAVAVLQLAGYVLVDGLIPAAASLNWPSLLILLLFGSSLSILSSAINREYVVEIERQTQQLTASEAALRELSVRDHLTQLFNRRYLEESLEREIRRSARAHSSIGIILFDLDQFKQDNDRWGHAAGDALLREIGRVAKQHIRGGDIACRYGGDEFVLVLPETSRQTTRARADGLRDAMKQIRAEYHGQSLGGITISAGIALYPQHGARGEDLIHAADQALYRAKEAGRDAVRIAERDRQPVSADSARG